MDRKDSGTYEDVMEREIESLRAQLAELREAALEIRGYLEEEGYPHSLKDAMNAFEHALMSSAALEGK